MQRTYAARKTTVGPGGVQMARQQEPQHNRRGPNEEREEPRLPREVRRHGRGGTEGRQSSPRNEEPVRPDVEETVSPHYSPCSSEDDSNSAQNPAPLPRQGPGTLQRPALPIPVGRDSQRPRGGIVDTNPEEGEQDQRYDEGGERVEQDQALADDTLSQPSSQSSDVQRRIPHFFSPARHMNRDDTSRGSDLNGGGSDSDSGLKMEATETGVMETEIAVAVVVIEIACSCSVVGITPSPAPSCSF